MSAFKWMKDAEKNAHLEQRAVLLKRLSFTPAAWLDNRRDMHFGFGLPEGIRVFGRDK